MRLNRYFFSSWLPISRPLAVLAAALLLAPAAWAQAPANDNCSGALVLPVGTSCTVTVGTNVNATASGLPAPTCAGAGTTGSHDVWYRLVVPAGGNLTVTTRGVAGSAFDDTVVELYAGTCNSLASIGCNDDDADTNDGFSSVTVTGQTAGSTVYARVFGFEDSATPTGQFGICATVPAPPPPPPANDNCASAVTLTAATTCALTRATNRGATASAGVPAPNSSGGAACFRANTAVRNDVWFSVVVPTSGALTVTTSAAANSALEDTGLTLYTGPCDALTEVACSDDITPDEDFFSSARITGLTPGATLYARVWSFGNSPTGEFNICAVAIPALDAAVDAIYALGKTPTSNPQVVKAVITNTGASTLTNVPVLLSVTGANSFSDAKILASLAPGVSDTLAFRAFTASTPGSNTLTVTLPADGLNTNNTQTYGQQVSASTFAVADPSQGPTNGSIGITQTVNKVITAGSGILAVKYSTPTARTLTAVNVWLSDDSESVGKTVYAVVLSSTGAILGRTPDYAIQAADLEGYKSFVLPTPVALPAGNFYAGFAQAASPAGTAPFFPLGLQTEEPTRPGTFYLAALTGAPLDDVADAGLGRFMIEAVAGLVQGTSAALNRAISLYPNPSTGQVTLAVSGANASAGLQVQVTNTLGQVVHTATIRDNARNTLDLSGLADGLYLLRVRSGAEYTLRQLVLTK